MKSVLVLVFALCALTYAFPRPGEKESKEDSSPDGESEIYIVPLQREAAGRPFGFGVTDELMPPPLDQHPFFRSNPWGPPAVQDDFMTQMQEMLREMRRQLTVLLSRTPEGGLPDNSSVGTRIGDSDDLPQNKSTSTTKVIDGHVVTVNETTFTSGNDDIGAVFRIKVVEVKPSEVPETETEGDVKPEEPEEPADPEIVYDPTTSKSELEEDKQEETNEIPNHNEKVRYEMNPELNPVLNEIEDPEVFSVEEFHPIKKESYYDLSSDTKVNDYFADQSEHQQLVMIEPDAEFIETDTSSGYPRRFQKMDRFSYS